MSIRVLGISGSPRHGNTEVLVRSALLGAEAVEGVQTELVSLSGKKIAPCDGCEVCLAKGKCVIQDDMQPIYPKLLQMDAIIMGAPVYFGSPCALSKAFMERVEGLGIKEKKLRFKVCGAITTAGSRNGGQELALMSIHSWAHVNDMIPIGVTSPVTQLGVAGNSSYHPRDILNDKLTLKVVKGEILTKEVAYLYGRKIATVAKIVKTGLRRSKLDMPDKPYGFGLKRKFPRSLYRIGVED